MMYPVFDSQWQAWGRLSEHTVQGPHSIFKISNGDTWKVHYHVDHDSLKTHDWVARTESNKIIRVAPALRPPISTGVNTETLNLWSATVFELHQYFLSENFIQIQTPTLVPSAGTEPSLDPFQTVLQNGGQVSTRFLPTSPELHLKKALSLGHTKIYELARCYRNNEVTSVHQPEFWMLEWYRGFSDFSQIQLDCVDLIRHLHKKFPKSLKPKSIQCWTVAQLFKKELNVNLTPDWTRTDYLRLAMSLNLHVNDSFSIDDLFFLIWLEKIEKSLPIDDLVFVEAYPPFQAALARKSATGWAERFEIYWRGMELANAFDELNDPVEQRSRAIEDLQKRAMRLGQSFDGVTGLDEEFFQALESGMPPSCGIALGVERLFMALFGFQNLNQIRLFSEKQN